VEIVAVMGRLVSVLISIKVVGGKVWGSVEEVLVEIGP